MWMSKPYFKTLVVRLRTVKSLESYYAFQTAVKVSEQKLDDMLAGVSQDQTICITTRNETISRVIVCVYVATTMC